jgi:LuxR family maltose regulon positive regulatory protein
MAEPPATTPAAAATAERDVLLATKLHVPPTRPGFVARPRLVDRLAPTHGGELTLVCAPAGFGKTALLADWARRDRRPVAWLSLDEGDNDPARFWRHVAAALDPVHPGVAQQVDALLQGLQPTSFEAVVTTLVNELAGVAEEVVLVLDDYHLIQAPAVHESVGFLLEHLPAQLRLVLASRADPPLPLARLRARGQLVELREHDLRFTPWEAAELLHAAVGPELPEAAVAALTDRTEGWAAGLQLAALSLQGRGDIAAFVEGFSGSHRYVLDYLTAEVLDRQPEQLRTFLLETSILERLSGPLCDAVTGRRDGQALLEQVERANLFLQPLDEERRWWRYHQLFADLLRARLHQQRPERVPELHRAAAAWFETHGLAEEAVRHALAAGEAAWVARLMERHFPGLLWVSEDTLSRLLAELPASVVREPWLCVALASRAAMGGRLEEAERLLAAAERAPAGAAGTQGPPAGTPVRLAEDLPSVIAMYRANFARIHGDAGPATRFAHRAQAELAGDDPLTRAVVEWNLAQADLLGGRLEGVEHALRRVMAAYRAAGMPLQAAAVCYDLAQVQPGLGRLGAAITTCREALELAAVDPDLSPAGAAHARLAELLRERDELDAALDHATRGVELCRQHQFAWPLAVALAALAWIRQAQGDPDGARAAMAEATQALPDPGLVDLFNPAPAQAARLALAQGRVEDGARFVRDRGLGPEDEPGYPREREYLVLARVLLAQQAPQRALGLLARLHALAAAQQRTGSVIQVRTLQALALDTSGDHAGGLGALAEALALGAPEGWLRVFLDEGPPMAALLRELLAGRRQQQVALADAVPREYLARLAEAFEQAGLPIRPPVGRGGVMVAGLVEPLTARELEVLQLLAAGEPNRAIAEALVVTQETVKKHLSHLFDKLGVANRTQAVARARQLGLLP